jgi:sugar phosphate isomerase/epimerase
MSSRLALDHLTVVDTTPSQLVSVAAEVGCEAVCLFMQPMDVLPRMPHFDLYGATAERRETRALCEGLGVGVDLVYPFTLTGRTEVTTFLPALETAAYLGARAVNVLLYDRDPARRCDVFSLFCALAAAHSLEVAVEFYPVSQVKSLQTALELVGRPLPGKVGVNVDLLHLFRSGGTVSEIARAPVHMIRYAQFCDGPAVVDQSQLAWEASSERLLPHAGTFDLAGFARALPPDVRTSVELPQEDALVRGVPVVERARRAVDAVRRAIDAAHLGPM